jgi:5-formyltetrahydrofolate cyclo-ligase
VTAPTDVPDRGAAEPDVGDAKRALRREMRELRRALPDQAERSTRLWSHVRGIPAVRAARTVMAFTSVPGEPDTTAFIAWLRSAGKKVVLPEDDPPPDPGRVDVVIVPGIAFTVAGDRLGQGGGWFDRFLAEVRPDCTTVGVGFAPQLVDHVPLEGHDVRLRTVVTDAGVASERNIDEMSTESLHDLTES